MSVKTRFAPSPTGFLHVGSVRTALYSWLYAKKNHGEFILRIEDTDDERSTQESVEAIIEGMAWLGLDYAKEPIYQTNRYPRYQAIAEQLLASGKAYRCTCSKERLDLLRETQLTNKEKPRYDGLCREKNIEAHGEPFVVRFKNPNHGIVSFVDEVYGAIEVDNSQLDDLVLLRTNGSPTYNFAVVIDDADMGITHVIRGDDHINNTPRQINLYQAIEAPLPIFAHLPMILGDDGKRLSKRHGAVSVMEFKRLGFLPQALLNYLVRLGWSFGDQEIFSVDEMIQCFDLSHVSRGVSSFNYDKLNWLNQHYLKTLPPGEVAKALAWHFEEQGIDISQGPKLSEVVSAQAERCRTLVEMCDKSRYFYQDDIVYDEEAIKKHVQPTSLEPLIALYERLNSINNWNSQELHQSIQDVCAQFEIGMGKLAQPLRVIVTGSTMSPSIDVTLMLIGKQRVLTRLNAFLN